MEEQKNFNTIEKQKTQWSNILKNIHKKTKAELEEARMKEKNKKFVRLVNQAKEDWKNAQNYFENVTNPDLIDLAIYRMEAARVYYMYLIKEAKRKGITA